MSGLRNVLRFSGRASRSAFWWYQLFVLVVLGSMVVFQYLLSRLPLQPGVLEATINTIAWILAILVPLFAVLSPIPTMVRRLHDTDRSGWWFWLLFVPFGGIALLVFVLQPGTPGPNRYDAPPTGPNVAD